MTRLTRVSRVTAWPSLPIALAALAALAGCVPSETPAYVSVQAFAAPRDPASARIVVWEPWAREANIDAKGAEVLRPLDDAKVRCVNVTCQGSSQSVSVVDRPKDLDHIEIVVERDGFEPARLTLPLRGPRWPGSAEIVVILTPKAAP